MPTMWIVKEWNEFAGSSDWVEIELIEENSEEGFRLNLLLHLQENEFQMFILEHFIMSDREDTCRSIAE